MVKTRFRLNGSEVVVDSDTATPLLWVIRDELGLSGTKFGCGAGLCGACTVHLDGEAIRSCQVSLEDVAAREVVTIEKLRETPLGQRIMKAWIGENVPQCGYCQPGMIMAAAAILGRDSVLDGKVLEEQLTNICRCGSYARIRKAIHRAAYEKDKTND